jgi:hypothetical protein
MENKILIGLKDELRSFAEDKKSEMSVNVYNYIWNIIQGIEHDMNKINQEAKDKEAIKSYDREMLKEKSVKEREKVYEFNKYLNSIENGFENNKEERTERNPAHYCFNCNKYSGFRGFCSKKCHDEFYDTQYKVDVNLIEKNNIEINKIKVAICKIFDNFEYNKFDKELADIIIEFKKEIDEINRGN